MNQFKVNSNENLSKSQEENEKLKKQIDQLKRIIFDIDSSSYFDKSDNLETFNSLYGESQALIVEGIVNKNNNSINQCIKNMNDLLSYLSNEQKKSNKPSQLTSFINVQSNNKKEKLLNLTKIDLIGINSDVTDMLYENNSLNSGELVNIIRKFNNFYIEIHYPSANYQNIYNCVSHLKSQNSKLKICVYINSPDKTGGTFKNNNNINMVKIGSSVTEIIGGLGNGSFENCRSIEKVFISNSVNFCFKFEANNDSKFC